MIITKSLNSVSITVKMTKHQIVYILLTCIWFSIVRAQLRPPRITEHPDSVVVKKHEPATLNCKADGKPTPTIEWYKDNELVHNTANRMVLPSGSLFFLHVINNKRDGDTGTYYCLAKNEVGKIRSRNASLDVALLRDEFKVMPKNVRVAAGETAVMECAPPRGFPEPVISWKRNGEKLNTGTGRIRLTGSNLMISEVRPGDEGRYQCIAENLVGVRESPPGLLNVQVKPFFIRGPEDVTALSSDHVEFHCKVGGDPTPTITWRRQDGKMPIGRAQILEDKALKIIHVTPADEGVYICEVENPVGTITSSATLIVHSRPTFLVTPKDIRVPVNNVAKLDCVATGNPPPSVFWTREGNQVLMFPGKIHGRFSVSSEGTLTISGVRKEDRGYYVCSALSVVGSSMAKAYLTVSAVADVPPPIIKLGPANQTLPQDTVAMLPCETLGSPQPVIKWLVNNKPVPLQEPRFVVLDSGTLQIDDLENSDSGIYTCIASSESGETSWSASLTVESPRNPNIKFYRMSDPSTFPGPPQKPTIVNMTETSVTISWRIGRPGNSPIIGSTIEYYSPDLQMGWTVAAKRIMTDIYPIHNLQPDMRYVFFVRSENSHGLGPPSPVSDEVRTLGSPSSQVIPDYDLDEARIRLSSKSTELKAVTAVSSTAVKLFWDLQGGHEFVEGFYVRYRDMSNGGTAQKYNMVTLVYNEHPSSHLLPDLRKFTKYEFFLVPFYKNVEGKPSNTRTAQTYEDVPSAPPENLNVKIVNLTSATIEWSPPAPQHRNGNLLGYNIHIQGNISSLHSNITLNATITSITLYNLTTGAVYSVRVLAFTTVGPGPFSSPIALRMDPNMLYSKHADTQPLDTTYLSGVVNQTWFYIVIIIISIVILSLIAIVIIMKRRIAWKKAISAHLTVPLHKSEEIGRGGFNGNAREALWINQGWRQSDKDHNATKLMNRNQNDMNNGYSSAFVADYCSVGNAPDYAEVDTHNLSTFYKKETSYPSSVPAPYATTTLINAVSQSKHGSVREHKSSGSEEMGSRKSEKPMPFDFNDDGAMDHLLAEQQAKSPSDSGSYTTDEYGMPVRKIKHNKHRQQNNSFRPNPIIMNGGSSVSANQNSKAPIVNWTDLIPPPPENPPSECGTPPDTPILNCSVRGHNPNRLIRVQLPPMAYIHSGGSGSGRSPLITRSYQASPANSRHSLSSPRSTLTRNKKVSDVMSSNSIDASMASHQVNRTQLPQFLQRLKSNQTPIICTHYAPSNASPHIITNPLMDRAIQSSLPSLMDEQQQQQTNKNQVMVGSYQRLEVDSDPECGRDSKMKTKNTNHSPPSSIGDTTDYAHCDRDESNSGTSHQSSDADDHESSLYAEADLANCIARAAQNAGFTFNEQSFVIEPQSQQTSNISKKFRHHQRAQIPKFRSTSPYSTDSNMSTAVPLQARHPPKFRKRQGSDRSANNQLPSPSSCSEHSPSYDMIQSDFANHLQHKQIKVPNAMHNINNSHDSTNNYPNYNKPIFQQTNKTNVINDKSQLSSPTSSKDFNLRTFALRLDARDTPIV